MVKVRITVSWDDRVRNCDLQFSDEDMAGDGIQVWESLKVAWTSIRGQYMHDTRGPKWYLAELKKKVEQMGQVWHG